MKEPGCFWKNVQDVLHVLLFDAGEQGRGPARHPALCEISCGFPGVQAREGNWGLCDLPRSVLKRNWEGGKGGRVGKVQSQFLASARFREP